MGEFEKEVNARQRFEFGENWARFLRLLNDNRIQRAEQSLKKMLECEELNAKRFLDIGSGSGLYSLAARRLGARVHSFDYDPQSVACTRELKRRYFRDDPAWTIEEASVLDTDYLRSLGQSDIVYSWGVLHHTGAMWTALGNIVPLVGEQGKLFISIYNDQGKWSRRWKKVKQTYNRLPKGLRFLISVPVFIYLWKGPIIRDIIGLRPFYSLRAFESERGTSVYRDLVDWVGGYPFEVATPEQIFDFYRGRGFTLVRLHTCGGTLGCNQFVFRKTGRAREEGRTTPQSDVISSGGPRRL